MNATKTTKIISKYINIKKYNQEQAELWSKYGWTYPTGAITIDWQGLKKGIYKGEHTIHEIIQSLKDARSLDLLQSSGGQELILYSLKWMWKQQDLDALNSDETKQLITDYWTESELIEIWQQCWEGIDMISMTWYEWLQIIIESILTDKYNISIDTDERTKDYPLE